MIHVIVMFGMEDPLCEMFSTEKKAVKGAIQMARNVYGKSMKGFELDEDTQSELVLFEINQRIPAPGIYYFVGAPR